MKLLPALASLLTALAIVTPIAAQATVINFEEFSPSPADPLPGPTNGYAFDGLTFTYWSAYFYAPPPPSGHVAVLNAGVQTMQMWKADGGTFTLNELIFSTWVTDARGQGTFTATGYLGNVAVGTASAHTADYAWKTLRPNFSKVDRVTFNLTLDQGGKGIFTLDNINVSAVPEPDQVLLLAAGLGVFALGMRRRRQA